MAGHPRERFFLIVVVLVAIAAVAVIAYKAEVIGWSSESAGAPVVSVAG